MKQPQPESGSPNLAQASESAPESNDHLLHIQQMTDYYAKTAGEYNAWHVDSNPRSVHNRAVEQVLRLLAAGKDRTLLDICCGTGRAVKAVRDRGYHAAGIDISKELLDAGMREFGLPSDALRAGDATLLPYADASFDIACVLGALHHSARPEAIVHEACRVSKSGLVVSDEGNGLSGGVKHLLQRLHIFTPVYRLIFRREPRKHRRASHSENDGPTYVFSAEEILPIVKSAFTHVRCIAIYRLGTWQIASRYLPRLFAKHVIIVATR
jgi:ubiquinone/menaquinone biosynthesis C-methylase UbiE